MSHAQYERLLVTIQDLLEAGRRRAEEAVGQELVCTYHAVGMQLLAQKKEGLAGYGTGTLQRLADDSGLNVRVLQLAVAFVQAYPKEPPQGGLRYAQPLLVDHAPGR